MGYRRFRGYKSKQARHSENRASFTCDRVARYRYGYSLGRDLTMGEVKEFKCPECDYVIGADRKSFDPPFCPLCEKERDRLVIMKPKGGGNDG